MPQVKMTDIPACFVPTLKTVIGSDACLQREFYPNIIIFTKEYSNIKEICEEVFRISLNMRR